MVATLKNLLRNEDGATLVEYGLIVALIAVVAIAAVKLLGTNTSAALNSAATNIAPPAGGG